MPLSAQQFATLTQAIEAYAFPAILRDFATGQPILGLTMTDVEDRISALLRSGSAMRVRDGLAQIIYWGFSQMGGLALVRSATFLDRTTDMQLGASAKLFIESARPSLLEIKALELPQFSATSFVSKIRMFLDPAGSATLDKQILKMKYALPGTILDHVAATEADTAIRLTQQNSNAYEAWCMRLDYIRSTYVPDRRVVDVERGLFHLVQSNHVVQAAEILRDA